MLLDQTRLSEILKVDKFIASNKPVNNIMAKSGTILQSRAAPDIDAEMVLSLLKTMQKSLQELQNTVDLRLNRMESKIDNFLKQQPGSPEIEELPASVPSPKKSSLNQISSDSLQETNVEQKVPQIPVYSFSNDTALITWKEIIKTQFPAGTLGYLRKGQRELIMQTMESFILHKLNDLYWKPGIEQGPSADGSVYPQTLDAFYDELGVMSLPKKWSSEFSQKLVDAFDGKPYPRPKLPPSIKSMLKSKKREGSSESFSVDNQEDNSVKGDKGRSNSVSVSKQKPLISSSSLESTKTQSTPTETDIVESPIAPAAKKRKRIVDSESSSLDEPPHVVPKPRFDFSHLDQSVQGDIGTWSIPVECGECRKTLTNRILYGLHLKTHEKKGVFICVQCHLRYTDDSSFKTTCVPSRLADEISKGDVSIPKGIGKKKALQEVDSSTLSQYMHLPGGPEKVDLKQFRYIEKCHEHRLYGASFDGAMVDKQLTERHESRSPRKNSPENPKSGVASMPPARSAAPLSAKIEQKNASTNAGFLSIKPLGFDSQMTKPRSPIRELVSFTAFMKESFPLYLRLTQDQKRTVKRKVRQWLIKELSEEEYLLILRTSSDQTFQQVQGNVDNFSQAKTFGIPLVYKRELIEYLHSLDLSEMFPEHAF